MENGIINFLVEHNIVIFFFSWRSVLKPRMFEVLCRTLLPFIEEQYGKRASALCLSFSYIPALLMELELLQGMYGFEKK